MGTEVLYPQDYLIDRLRVGPAGFSRKKFYAGNPNPNPNPKFVRKQVTRPEPRRRFPQSEWSSSSISKKSTVTSDESKSAKNFVMGQVTILKRGESLDAKRKNEIFKKNDVYSSGDLIICSTERLGPDPEMVPKQIRMTDLKTMVSPVALRPAVYAGSAFSLSPSPSSLPLPTFSKKKEGLGFVEDSATKDLRRLLRLD